MAQPLNFHTRVQQALQNLSVFLDGRQIVGRIDAQVELRPGAAAHTALPGRHQGAQAMFERPVRPKRYRVAH